MKKKSYIIILALFLALPSLAAKPDPNLGLANWSVQAFSDHASHMALLHQAQGGVGAWRFKSAWAFGSRAAGAYPARDLFDARLTLQVAGRSKALFSGDKAVSLKSYPYWSFEDSKEGGVEVNLASMYISVDTLLFVATFKNRSSKNLKVRPVWTFSSEQNGAQYSGRITKKGMGEFVLNLDRSKLVQRKLVEHAAFLIGGGRTRARFDGPGADPGKLIPGLARSTDGAFTLQLTSTQTQNLAAGQRLRFPMLVSISNSEEFAREKVTSRWKGWALTRKGYETALGRWRTTVSRLPKAPNKKWQKLLKRAAVTLKHSEYGPRGELNYAMFSSAKGFDDAFYSHTLPIAALGWADLDLGKAQQAVMQLSAYAAAKPAAVPPFSGEDMFAWDASGLPLHGLLSWDLVHRDGNLGRAEQFFQGFGTRMLNEAAWWPPHRDGDGNGLYAFADDLEKPQYLTGGFAAAVQEDESETAFDEPRGKALAKNARLEAEAKEPQLQAWSVALSSLVAWQLQASAAMAQRNADTQKASKLLAQARGTAAAMLKKGFKSGSYVQGLDGLFPFLTGLDSEPARARAVIERLLLKPMEENEDALPFVEKSVLYPWRAWLMLKVLSLYGYHKQADDAAARLLSFFEKQSAFYSAYSAQGKSLGWPGASATAAVVLGMAMERYQDESFLLKDTRSLVGRMLQLRSPDGSLFIKVVPPRKKKEYALISVASPKGGAIFEENAMIFVSDRDVTLSMAASFPVDVKQMDLNKWNKNKKSLQMNLKAKKRYLFKFHR